MSTKKGKKMDSTISRGLRKKVQPEAEAPVQPAAQPPVAAQPSADFERELQDHFAAEACKKVEQETEHIFGSILARHGWVRNERGQVEYVGGEGA